MAKPLNIRHFFKRASKEWLRRYFERRGLLPDFDWASVTKRKIDPLLNSWLSLGPHERQATMNDFQEIELLATPVGKVQFIDEAAFQEKFRPGVHQEVSTKMLELGDYYACAFWVLLTHEECWKGALRYAVADGKSKTYWRKRSDMPRLGREPTDDDAKRLGVALSDYFMRNQGRGRACVVHPYRRGLDAKREYFFAYPEDHEHTPLVFDDGELVARSHNPAFEVIFIHDEEQQILNIWHDGNREQIADLQVLFAHAVMGQVIPKSSPKDDRVYQLQNFLNPDFTFRPDAMLGIEDVELRAIRVKVGGQNGRTIIIELHKNTPNHVLHQSLVPALCGILPSQIEVTLIKLRVTFAPLPNKTKRRSREFRIATPNSCSLKIDEFSPLIERMLVDHGIEPRRTERGQ